MKKRVAWAEHTQGLWTTIQAFAVVAALTLPVVARLNTEVPKPLDKNTLSANWKAPNVASVHLPAPDEMSRTEGLRLTVEAKQMRFEHRDGALVRASADRRPASSSRWRLKELRRIQKDAAAWEPVGVIRGSGTTQTSSIFVELDEGSNTFEAVFVDPTTGRTASYPVRVDHVRESI